MFSNMSVEWINGPFVNMLCPPWSITQLRCWQTMAHRPTLHPSPQPMPHHGPASSHAHLFTYSLMTASLLQRWSWLFVKETIRDLLVKPPNIHYLVIYRKHLSIADIYFKSYARSFMSWALSVSLVSSQVTSSLPSYAAAEPGHTQRPASTIFSQGCTFLLISLAGNVFLPYIPTSGKVLC